MMTEAGQTTKSREPDRRRIWKRRLLALCLGSLASLLLLEITFRIYVAARGWTTNCYVPHLQMMIPHPEIGYEMRPGFEFESATTRIELNSRGLRSPEPTGDRPLIVTMGGSSVFGYFVGNGETASDLLRDRLRDSGFRVDVQNAGVPGYNLNQTIVRFRERVAPLKPDYVLLYLGWNDLRYVVSEDPLEARFLRPEIPSEFERVLSHSVFYGFVRFRLFTVPGQFAPPLTTSLHPTEAGTRRFLGNLHTLADEIEKSGARLLICCQMIATHPDLDPSVHKYLSENEAHRNHMIELGAWLHDRLEEFAQERDAVWIDAWIPPHEALLGDAIHLTREGERAVAEMWYESFLEQPEFQSR
jgi:lysophospholipase L1-like esterase